jgi:hypothetical protein
MVFSDMPPIDMLTGVSGGSDGWEKTKCGKPQDCIRGSRDGDDESVGFWMN